MVPEMRTEIQYGVRYIGSGQVAMVPGAFEANKLLKRLYEIKVPAEVVCRRITYGAWVEPRVKLLSGVW